MEKQLAFFHVKEKDDFQLWFKWPEKNRHKMETIFAKLLIRYLSESLEEVKKNEK